MDRWITIPKENSEVHVKVREIMSTPVVTVDLDAKADLVSKSMQEKNVGSIVVIDKNKKPVGIITERDIVRRVASKNIKPSEVQAAKIMSKPLKTIDSKASILDASKSMRDLKVRRLIVIDESSLAGIISSDDIVEIMPELITIISEEATIGQIRAPIKEAGIAGRCDICDQWSSNLVESDGSFLCEECRPEI